MIKNYRVGSILLSTLLLFSSPAISKESSHHTKLSSKKNVTLENNSYKKIAVLNRAAPGLNKKVLKLALTAYGHARKKGMDYQQILTVVDYSKPDTSKRLWVFNLKTNRLLFHTLVAHAKNSGDVHATRFSNNRHSRESCLGLFLTKDTYIGHHGYSLHIKGLSKGFNTNAAVRNVVMHRAWYVSEDFVKKNHRLGRSWGCLALNKAIATPLIKKIKEGTLIFAYANNKHWLNNAPYLKCTRCD